MSRTAADSEAWKRIVLRSMPLPGWLNGDGPRREIVLSTRVRFMRNLQGHRFPHAADSAELREIAEKSLQPFIGPDFEVLKSASPSERDYLVACRLVSPDFDWAAIGRALVLDHDRSASVMINEEDHLRIQTLVPGWSLNQAIDRAQQSLELAEGVLRFARNETFGYLAASPFNCGEGRRYSAMFHLIGLAHLRKLGTVIKALMSQGMVVRGLFGERSRAIGAFLQVSTTATSIPYFIGACEYLLEEETKARQDTAPRSLDAKTAETEAFVQSSQAISLADALRVLAWTRWQSCQLTSVSRSPRSVDARIPELALLESLREPFAGRSRAELLRKSLHSTTG